MHKYIAIHNASPVPHAPCDLVKPRLRTGEQLRILKVIYMCNRGLNPTKALVRFFPDHILAHYNIMRFTNDLYS